MYMHTHMTKFNYIYLNIFECKGQITSWISTPMALGVVGMSGGTVINK